MTNHHFFFLGYTVVLSDTDSLLLSLRRERTALERFELTSLLEGRLSIPYHESLVATTLAGDFIRAFGRLLDWSSIDNEVGVAQVSFHGLIAFTQRYYDGY